MLLLDTCTLLWLVNNRRELSNAAARAIDRTRTLFVSAASAFEIGTKHRQGRLALARDPVDWWSEAVSRLELLELGITAEVALSAATLPTTIVVDGRSIEHKDPGDRFLVATAMAHGLAIVTPDPKIAAYPGTPVIW
jgi:PIN domain nuclease of toxin-antitoxin system